MTSLLVQPKYYTKYPPLGLLKISTWLKNQNEPVIYHRGLQKAEHEPSNIYLTSLFTYSWKAVHETASYYRKLYPNADIILGGIYATLMPDHAGLSEVDEVHQGLFWDAENCQPDYTLVPEFKADIFFTSRGCIRKCPFCAVPIMEGYISQTVDTIKPLIRPNCKKLVLWDNNFLASPLWKEIISEFKNLDLQVDFNQGLDVRLLKPEVINTISGLNLYPIHLAYDNAEERELLAEVIPRLEQAGFDKRNIIVYTLFNYMDTPDDFWHRVTDLLAWGVVCYPMRYEPLYTLVKNKYVSPNWTPMQLEMVAQARRVIGTAGVFPPYQALVQKISTAVNYR